VHNMETLTILQSVITQVEAIPKGPLISDPISLFAFFSALVAVIFYLGEVKALKKFFHICPPLIWCYFVPMICTTIGITPASSELYSFMSVKLLPAVLVLLMITTNVPLIMKLGPRAIGMTLFGSVGIVVGGVVAFVFGKSFFTDLDPETWKGMGALAGSWIGGSTNMLAIKESIGTPEHVFTPFIVVDTVVGYGWLAVLIFLSGYQETIDRWTKADTSKIKQVNEDLAQGYQAHKQPLNMKNFALMLGVAFAVGQLCLYATSGITYGGEVFSPFAWGILLITAVSLALSFTKLRELEYSGAAHVGYYGLYVLLATIGAKADLTALAGAHYYFAIGFVWLLIHIAFLIVGLLILRAPLFLFACGSMSNIGGTASTPVVAAAYQPSMATVGLLMAIVGTVVGTPLGLLMAHICSKIA
jgi:uncharacterized membrane protein